MNAARLLTAGAVDSGEKPAVLSAVVKYNATERMRQVLNDAMDVQGGSGICLGPRNLLGRVYQAVPISITVEGANILTRSMIIFGQGALRSHPHVLRELEAVQDPDAEAGLHAFDRALTAHLRWGLGNALRSLWYGLTGARLLRLGFRPQGEPATAYRQLTRLSTAFAFSADLAMFTLGGSLKRRERLSARLGDVLSHLYLGSAALKQFHDQGCPDADRPLVEWAWRECAHRAQEALLALCDNFPNRWLGRLLRLWLFPLGRSFAPPSDRLSDEVVELLLRPGEARDRLTHGLFLPEATDETLSRLEAALTLSAQAEPVLRRIRTAMQAGRMDSGDPEQRLEAACEAGVITEADAQRVRDAIDARREVIAVDAFDPADLGRNPDRNRTTLPTSQAEAG
jgi:acyl-CoA dehydrogenase